MCTGKSAFAAQKNQYYRDVKQRRVDWDSQENIWSMKNDQYKINVAENVLGYTRAVGATQRNFGNEISNFLESNKMLFSQALAKAPVNEGDRSRTYGRSHRLQELYGKGILEGNLRRADIKQTEDLRTLNRQLLSRQNQEIGRRGFAPIPSVAPAKPVGPSMLEQGIAIASTAASFISPVQSIGGALGIGAQGSGFLNKFFQGGSNVAKATTTTPASFMTGQSNWYT